MAGPYNPPGAYGQPPAQGYGSLGGFAPPAAHVDPQVMSWFQAVDQDRTGQISVTELQQALTNANWEHFNAETCRLLIGLFDRDYSGQISVNEFQALWTYIHEWKNVFDQFDRDRSGNIDANELCTAFNQMGYRVSPQFSHLVVMRYDSHGRRTISFDNFIQASILLKSVTETFRTKDTGGQGQIRIAYEEFMSMVILNKP